LICACALILSAGSVWLLLRYWRIAGAFDHGDQFRKTQTAPVLRVGGLAILVAFGITTCLAGSMFESFRDVHVAKLLLLSSAMFAIGFTDDLRPLPAVWRLLAQVGVACLAYYNGFRIDSIDLPLAPKFSLVWLSLPVTVFWLIALPNIFNLSDGMDGLAGGLGSIIFIVLGVASLLVGNPATAILAFIMAAAIGGFLIFNLPPAKIYLGDGGAYLIGFYAALLTIQSSQKGTAAIVLMIVMVVLAYPMADAAFAICRRFIYGFPIFRADAEHLHHRMITLGLPRGWLLAAFYGLFLCLAIGGLGMMFNRDLWIPVSIGALGLLVLAAFYTKAYSLHPGNIHKRIGRALRARRRVRYSIRLALVLEHELDFTPEADRFWSDFLNSVQKTGLEPIVPGTAQGPIDHCSQFSVDLGSHGEWRLACPEDTTMTEWNWRKVAQCFLPCLTTALKRWPAPAEIGICKVSDTTGEQLTQKKQSLSRALVDTPRS